MPTFDDLVKRGENRIADWQDAFATTHCIVLDKMDDGVRLVRREARNCAVVMKSVTHELVAPLVGTVAHQIKLEVNKHRTKSVLAIGQR